MDQDQPPKKKSFTEAFGELMMTPEESEALEASSFAAGDTIPGKPRAQPVADAGDDEGGTDDSPLGKKADNPGDPDAMPDWVVIPQGMKFPQGEEVAFMLFRADWTRTRHKGDRHCILWSLSDGDEKLALKRTRGEQLRSLSELAKQMIRAVDGHKADWTGRATPGNVDRFWNEIGSKCRQQIQNLYLKTHTLSAEETADFFLNCIVVRSAVAG